MGAEALSFVLRAAGSEHHQSSTRRVFTYVVGGRVGMNDTCYFSLDMKKLGPTPPPSFQDLDSANGSGNRMLSTPHPIPPPSFQDLDSANGSGNRMLSTPHPTPTPILAGFRQCKWKWKPYAINPPPHPTPILPGSRQCKWLLNPAVLVVEPWLLNLGC